MDVFGNIAAFFRGVGARMKLSDAEAVPLQGPSLRARTPADAFSSVTERARIAEAKPWYISEREWGPAQEESWRRTPALEKAGTFLNEAASAYLMGSASADLMNLPTFTKTGRPISTSWKNNIGPEAGPYALRIASKREA